MNIIERIKMDYFTRDRLGAYKDLLKYAIDNGYKLMTLRDFWFDRQNHKNDKVIMLRHDIDTALPRARDIYLIEKELDAIGSYYFRLKMLDVPLMQEIEKNGGEASYHFEEIATYIKLNKIKNANTIYNEIEKIQKNFVDNYKYVKKITGLPLLTVASHGDFVNQRLGISNNVLMTDKIRRECGILVEAYDHELKNQFLYISDVATSKIWDPQILLSAVKREVPRIYFLTHPRQWGSSWWHNTKANFIRINEDIRYRF